MTTTSKAVLILGNLDEDDQGNIVLRGSLDPLSHLLLQVDWYQRESGFSVPKLKKMMTAMVGGKLQQFPDITLGMRGHKWESAETAFRLHDPVYIIDGLQRWTALGLALDRHPEIKGRIGCKVYFNTNVTLEREMFRALNTGHTSMAPSVILRNEKEDNRIAGTLYGLSHQEGFALKDRICWSQKMERGRDSHLMRGAALLNLMADLHGHKIRCGGVFLVLDLLRNVEAKIDLVGLQEARDNLVTFFDCVDKLWGVRNQPYFGQTYLSYGWLGTLAKLFSNHKEFWRDDGTRLFVPANYMRDLERLDPDDPELRRLAGSNKTGRQILYEHFLKRLNHGKSNKLKARDEDEGIGAAMM